MARFSHSCIRTPLENIAWIFDTFGNTLESRMISIMPEKLIVVF